jgi:hypothetical protein
VAAVEDPCEEEGEEVEHAPLQSSGRENRRQAEIFSSLIFSYEWKPDLEGYDAVESRNLSDVHGLLP